MRAVEAKSAESRDSRNLRQHISLIREVALLRQPREGGKRRGPSITDADSLPALPPSHPIPARVVVDVVRGWGGDEGERGGRREEVGLGGIWAEDGERGSGKRTERERERESRKKTAASTNGRTNERTLCYRIYN